MGGPHGGAAIAGMMPGEGRRLQSSMLKLIKLMGGFKAAIAVVFVFAIGSTVFNIVGPKVLHGNHRTVRGHFSEDAPARAA
ncbi:MAG: hypothetical protein ACLT98_13205 [Eggerthellaceae bacterium]